MSKSSSEHIIEFFKFHGAGNDFIIIDNQKLKLEFDAGLVRHLCNRHLGIGADGLIRIEQTEDADFRMIYHNSDGNEGSMCGNGGRSAAAFACKAGITGNHSHFIAFDGMHEAWVEEKTGGLFDVRLTMADVEDFETINRDLLINTGSPHYIRKVDDVNAVDVLAEGKGIRFNKQIAQNGVNVNFVQAEGALLRVRTYERGVEAETLSCGTGVTASAIANCLWSGTEMSEIHTLGGVLTVTLKKAENRFTNIILSGPVQMVFKGVIVI